MMRSQTRANLPDWSELAKFSLVNLENVSWRSKDNGGCDKKAYF